MHISYHAVNSLVLYFIPVHCISTVHHPHLGIEGVFRFKWHEKLFCRLVPNSLYNLTPPLTNELRGLRGEVRREQREGDSCPHGFGLLCLTEYLWITWNSTENTPNHTSYPTERFGKGVKLEERVLIVMKTQDFLCFLSCFASFELGKLCFAFFAAPNFFLQPSNCVFTAGLSNCPHCLLLARREWGVDCVPCLFKLFTPAFFCSQCFIVFFQRAASQRLAYPLPSSLAALRHHVSKRLPWRSWGKLMKTFLGSLFSCPE